MDTGQWIVIGIAIFIWVWYLIGYFYNRKRAEALFRWLEKGLNQIGDQARYDRIGRFASGVRIDFDPAKPPYRQAQLYFFIDPRENLPFWLVHRFQGRGDEIYMKANLVDIPQQELVIAQKKNRDFRRFVLGQQTQPFELAAGPHGFDIARRGRLDERTLERMRLFLERFGKAIALISLRQKEPHLTLRASLAPLQSIPSKEFLIALKQVLM